MLEDIAQYTGGMMRAGVAGYPEGHPSVAALDLIDALQEKQHLASHVVTQMCFDAPENPRLRGAPAPRRRKPARLGGGGGVRARGPSWSHLATQIGVGSSLKFLSRKGPLARKLLSGDRYSPNALVAGLESQPGIAGHPSLQFQQPGHGSRRTRARRLPQKHSSQN